MIRRRCPSASSTLIWMRWRAPAAWACVRASRLLRNFAFARLRPPAARRRHRLRPELHDLDDPPPVPPRHADGDFVRTAIRQAEPFPTRAIRHPGVAPSARRPQPLAHADAPRACASAAAADAVSAEARTKAVTAQRDSLRKQIELHAARVASSSAPTCRSSGARGGRARARRPADRARAGARVARGPQAGGGVAARRRRRSRARSTAGRIGAAAPSRRPRTRSRWFAARVAELEAALRDAIRAAGPWQGARRRRRIAT